jgi:hypothetical protein
MGTQGDNYLDVVKNLSNGLFARQLPSSEGVNMEGEESTLLVSVN